MTARNDNARRQPGAGTTNSTFNSDFSPIDHLLSRLEGVRRTGPETYIARCPGPIHQHGDRHPSLNLREKPDGRILIHCQTGDSPEEILDAIGLTFSDLFPKPLGEFKGERRPFPAADILRCIAFEVMLVGVAGCDLVAGKAPTAEEKERLILAVGRIQNALAAAGIDHD